MEDSYSKLLSVAEKKAEEQRLALLKRKRLANGGRTRGPDPAAVAAFKARKEREERERMLRAQREREILLALRAENSKTGRKAQMMRSRTKDNDFSKMIETNQDRHIDAIVRGKGIKDTRERMKARLNMEQQLTGLNRKQQERVMMRLERDQPVKVSPAAPVPKIGDIIKGSGPSVAPAAKAARAPPPSYDELLSLAAQKAQTKVSLQEEIQRAQSEMEAQRAQQRRALTQKEKERQREESFYKSRAHQATLKQSAATLPITTTTIEPATQMRRKPPEPIAKAKAVSPQPKSKVVAPPPPGGVAPRRFRDGPLPGPSYGQQYLPQKRSAPPPPETKPRVVMPAKRAPPPLSPRPPRPRLPPIGASYRRGMYNDYDDDGGVGQEEEEDYYDEEEDDDMADFIDDEPTHEPEEEEYSRHIREIFGYDKRKYRHVIDDDDDVEVANYGQVMKEEAISLREGVREDLEDIEREMKEKKMKQLRQKARQKGSKRC